MPDPETVTSTQAYALVRLTNGKEWIDVGSLGCLPEDVKYKVNDVDEKIPHWAKANPVVRLVRVEINEVAE